MGDRKKFWDWLIRLVFFFMEPFFTSVFHIKYIYSYKTLTGGDTDAINGAEKSEIRQKNLQKFTFLMTKKELLTIKRSKNFTVI